MAIKATTDRPKIIDTLPDLLAARFCSVEPDVFLAAMRLCMTVTLKFDMSPECPKIDKKQKTSKIL